MHKEQLRWFSEEKAAFYIKQIVKAFIHMHSKNIIHRDIKPENLLNCNETIKISDFGWSAHTPTANKRKTFCGTLDYLSPEMID